MVELLIMRTQVRARTHAGTQGRNAPRSASTSTSRERCANGDACHSTSRELSTAEQPARSSSAAALHCSLRSRTDGEVPPEPARASHETRHGRYAAVVTALQDGVHD